MSIQELLSSGQSIIITVGLSELNDFAKFIVSETKNKLELDVLAAKTESYLTRLETCEFLKVNQCTLFRWSKRNYLNPVELGGRRLYKMSDLQRILTGSK
jgi:hypothetical protein